MTIQMNKIYWLAGLLEGEGYFGLAGNKKVTPQIILNMCDKDIVEKAARLMERPNTTQSVYCIRANKYNKNANYHYSLRFSGIRAAEWMMTIYKFMGNRRKEKIRHIILTWRNHGVGNYRKERECQK